MEIAARYRPAGIGAEVGGDFYDVWPVDDGFALAIGDVAGKGPAAAALTALTRHAMRVASRYESSPSRVLQVANETILAHDSASEFCTAALALLRPADDGYDLTVACAGHAPPFVLRARTREIAEAGICGTLLGVDLRAEFHDFTTHLAVGDLLAFWTDGVTERRNAGELFGEQRLADAARGPVRPLCRRGRPGDRRGRRRVRARPSRRRCRDPRRASHDEHAGEPRTAATSHARPAPGALSPVRIAILVTCLNDALFPEAGAATARVLERLGHEAVFPRGQTCCGQMHWNSGYRREAIGLIRRTVETLRPYELVVCPSGSCTAMIREHYARAAADVGDDGLSAEASTRCAAEVFELSELLVDRLGVEDVGAELHARAVYHPTCHSLRGLRVGDRRYRLLRAVAGLELVELPSADECCGFGGTFAVKNAETSAAMGEDKAAAVPRRAAPTCWWRATARASCTSAACSSRGSSACGRCTSPRCWLREPRRDERAASPPSPFPEGARGELVNVQLRSEPPRRDRHDRGQARPRRRRAAGLGAAAPRRRVDQAPTLRHLDGYLEELEAA